MKKLLVTAILALFLIATPDVAAAKQKCGIVKKIFVEQPGTPDFAWFVELDSDNQPFWVAQDQTATLTTALASSLKVCLMQEPIYNSWIIWSLEKAG